MSIIPSTRQGRNQAFLSPSIGVEAFRGSVFPGTGFNAYATTESYASVPIPDAGMYVYAESIVDGGLTSEVVGKEIRQSPYDNKTQVVAAHVAMHELGHSFGAGEADDKGYGLLPFEEVYSNENKDPTPEPVTGRPVWSIMRQGWDDDSVFTHNGTIYYAFSAEEVSTSEKP